MNGPGEGERAGPRVNGPGRGGGALTPKTVRAGRPGGTIPNMAAVPSRSRGQGDTPEILWSPPADVRERSRIGRYLTWLEATSGLRFDTYDALWRWSVDHPGAFWQSVWDHFAVNAETPPETALENPSMPGARWFPGATLNYAAHELALPGRDGSDIVVVAHSQTREPLELTADELRDAVRRCRAGLIRLGVRRGDRVAALLPNIPEALVAFLATASLGAVWSSCAPEFGVRAIIDRFAQIEPVVLLTIDGYRYGDRDIDRRDTVAEIRAALPTVRATVVVPYLDPEAGGEGRGPAIEDAIRGRRCSPSAAHWPSSPSRSTTRCTSCSRRAPPAFPSRSSTGTAGSCSSISRRLPSTWTSVRMRASSGSPRPAG